MTITYGFYNSVNGDRTYNAEEMSSIFDGIIEDGVLGTIGDALAVTELDTPDMSVNVGSGRAWFNHTWTLNASDLILSIDNPDPLYPRYDAVVLEIDARESVRENSIKVIKGTAASSPSYPDLTGDTDLYRYPLAYIRVNVGATSILNANITNMIGSGSCPYVVGPLTVVDTTALVLQWESQFTIWMDQKTSQYELWYLGMQDEFDIWFDNVKGQLGTDPAGNLQNQIDDILANELRIVARQGGDDMNTNPDDEDWGFYGVTDYTSLPKAGIQVGVGKVTGGAGQMAITFPTPFLTKPIVKITPFVSDPSNAYFGHVISVSTIGFTMQGFVFDIALNEIDVMPNDTEINWDAVGPVP